MNRYRFLLGYVAVAIVGGGIGGLIVWAAGGSSGSTTVTGATSAACPAANVADEALASVVTVGAGQSSGSGVVIRPGGYILTNNHVISPAAGVGTVTVLRDDGEASDAAIVGRDPLTDLAVIRAKDASGLPPIAMGESESLRVGQPVVALGSPLGLTSSVTSGIVSALNRYVRVPSENGGSAHLVGAIQTDASINPGNSGGALVDCRARLVGINTAGASVSGAGGSIGLGFAIPIDLAKGIADQLIAGGRVSRPSFGMQVQTIAHARLFVQAVSAGGPADKAGLHRGDIIVEVDGEPASTDALIVKTLSMKPGDVVHLKFERDGTSHTATLTLAAQGA